MDGLKETNSPYQGLLLHKWLALIIILAWVHFEERALGNGDEDDQNNVKKTIGLMIKTTSLHMHNAFYYTSLTSTAQLRRETS